MKMRALLLLIPLTAAGNVFAAADVGERGNPREVRPFDQQSADRNNFNYRGSSVPVPYSEVRTASDEEIATQIYQSILEDQSLSSEARDIDVVVNGGRVTLLGNVSTEFDRSSLERIAGRIAGPNNVTNDIAVTMAH